jgi:hypothetical protein
VIYLHIVAFFASMVLLVSSVFCPIFPISRWFIFLPSEKRQEDYPISPFKEKYFSPKGKKTYE